MTTTPITVIIADDHPMFRVALRLGVHSIEDKAVVIEVDSFESVTAAAAVHPDAALVLLDLMMPGSEGLTSLQFLRTNFPALRVAVISSMSQQTWQPLVQALGAVAFVHKSAQPEQMQQVLRRLLAGEEWWPPVAATHIDTKSRPAGFEERLSRLTRQELRILLHIKDGRLNKQIAGDLGISESTVKTHISTILRKLELQRRTQAAVLAQRLLAAPDG